MTKEIVVTVESDGSVSIEAVGFKGRACEQATKALEEALGTPAARKKKPEYYGAETTIAKQKVGG